MAFQSLGNALSRSFNQQAELKGQLLTARVLYIANEILKNLWSSEQAAYVKVASFSAGTLIFSASMGAAAQTLKLQAPQIQNAINHELGGKVIHAIEVRHQVN